MVFMCKFLGQGGFFVIKRIAIAIIVFAAMFLLASALVGSNAISANLGLILWLVGLIAAIAVFVKMKPKDT